MELPKVDSENKTILMFSGGAASTLIALEMLEQYGSLENVLAFFYPLDAATKIYQGNEKFKQIIVNQEKMFDDMCEKIGLENRFKLTSYDFKNGDNLILDSGRLDAYSDMLRLVEEQGIDLTQYSSIVVGFTKRFYETIELFLTGITEKEELLSEIQGNPERYRGIIERDSLDNYTDIVWLTKFAKLNERFLEPKSEKIYLPLKNYTKKDVFAAYNMMLLEYKEAVLAVCQNGYPTTCGKCDTCVERQKILK